MITKSPYGFGYGHKGRIVGTEPEPGPREFIRHQEPQAVIDRCLNCTIKNCTGECDLTPNGKIKSRYRQRNKKQVERQRLAQELERKETEKAKEVARMYLDGWCESAVAREKGYSTDEVYSLIKLARKKGFLY